MVETADVGTLVLERYRIVRRLAVGGMGDIFLARTEGAAGFVRPVVIKQIRPELVKDAEAVRMFEREARINARLSHPNIVEVIDFRRERDAYLMVMEYVNGVSLASWLTYHRRRGRAVGVDVALALIEPVLEALVAVHGLVDADGRPMPIIHRDLTPSNVLVDRTGHVKLMDFGIARLEEPTDSDEYATQTHAIKGKVLYLPPEVLEGRPATTRSDLYAVGLVLHEALAGQHELRAPATAEALHRILTHELTPLHDLRDDVSTALSQVVARATARDPEDRFSTAREFLDAIRGVREGSVESTRDALRRQLTQDLEAPEMSALLGDLHPTQLDRTWRVFQQDEIPDLEFVDETDTSASPGSETETAFRPGEDGGESGRWRDTALPLETLAEQTARLQAERPNHLALHDDVEVPELDWGPDGPPREESLAPEGTSSRGRGPARLVAFAVLAIVLGLAGAWLGPQLIDQVTGPGPGVGEPSIIMEVSPPGASESTGVGGEASGPSRREHFEKQKPLLAACVKRLGKPRRDLASARFEYQIGADGRPEKVLLYPPELAASELGRCLVQAASEVRFGEGQGGRFTMIVGLGR